MSRALDFVAGHAGAGAADAFGEIEFEIALDLEDPALSGFENCVSAAAAAVGGEFLFDMPADGTIEDASRIAAVRIPQTPRDAILFAVLDARGTSLRVANRRDIGDRFYGFARAFVGVLERLRERQPMPAASQLTAA